MIRKNDIDGIIREIRVSGVDLLLLLDLLVVEGSQRP